MNSNRGTGLSETVHGSQPPGTELEKDSRQQIWKGKPRVPAQGKNKRSASGVFSLFPLLRYHDLT